MNSAIEHINKNLNIEIEDIKYKLNGNNQFDIYVRSLSLLKDIKHLDKNLGLNYGGLDSFRDFVNGLENSIHNQIEYPSLPPPVDAVFDNDIEKDNEEEFIPKELTNVINNAIENDPSTSEKNKSNFNENEKEKRDQLLNSDSNISERQTQQEITDDLTMMTDQLKKNALALSEGLASDVPLLEQASNKLETNADKMTNQRKQLNAFSSSSSSMGWLTLASIVMALVAWIIIFIIIKIT